MLCLALGIPAAQLVSSGEAVAEPAQPQCVDRAPDRVVAQALASSCGRRVEVLSARTPWETEFAEPDGVSVTWESSARAVRSRVNGEWSAISTAVVAGPDGLRPVASALPMTFSPGGDAPLARIGRDGHELIYDSPLPGRLPAPVVSGDSVTYPEVLPGVDLILTVTQDGTGFSQVLRVASPRAAAHRALASLRFPVRISAGLRIEGEGGGFAAVDAAGVPVFTSPRPRMWDSSGLPAAGVDHTVAGAAPGRTRLERPLAGDRVAVMPVVVSPGAVTVTPVASMLAGESTAWPVYIDPTVSGGPNEWTMIQSGFGGDDAFWKFTGGDGTEGTGRCQVTVVSACVQNNTKRVIWEFGFPAVVRGTHVLSATFKAYQSFAYDCDTGWVRVYKTAAISSSTVWDNFHLQMDGDNSLRSVDETRKSGCPLGPGWTSWSVTSGVQASANANATWIALGVRSTNETSMPSSWKRFRFDAVLSITYNTKPGTPALTAPAAGAITTDTTPTLQAKTTDVDGNSVRHSFEIHTPGGTLVKSGNAAFVSSGATASWTPTALAQGDFKFRARAYDGHDYGSWSGYRNFSVDRSGPTATGRKTNGSTACGQLSTDTTPTLSVVLTDNYGGNLEADFELRNSAGTLVVDTGTSLAALPSGSTFSHTTPALANGSYEWRVGGRDARNLWGPYTAWCAYTVDTTPPDAPAVNLQGDPYQLGVSGTFTASGGPDVAAYKWGLNTDTPTTVIGTTAGAPQVVTIPGSSLSTFGPNWVSVRSVDEFGRDSDDLTRIVFHVEGFGENGRWQLDGAGQDVDCSSGSCVTRTGGHPLTFTGTHQWVDGRWAVVEGPFGPEELDPTDRAASLDGSTGYGATQTVGPVQTTSNFSVAAWVRMAPIATFPAAVSQIGNQAAAFYLGYAEGSWAFSMKPADVSGGTVRATSPPVTPDPDVWVHLLGVYDHANRKIQLYVDGELVDEAPFAATWQAGGPLLVGRSQAQAALADFWPGVIDDVRIFPGALNAEAVLLVYEEERIAPPPAVAATAPAADTIDAPLDTTITVEFSKPVDPESVNVQLEAPGAVPVAGTQDYDPGTDTATFTPAGPLASQTEYTVTVSDAVDLEGKPMAEPVTWWFTTEQGDTTPPTVNTLAPAPDATDVARDTAISAVFSEPVDPATIMVEVRDLAEALVPGSTSYDPGTGTVTFTPGGELASAMVYTAAISGAVDAAENVMTPESWSFTAELIPIGIDDSSPARVTNDWEGAVTTAPFDPPAGSVLLAMVSTGTTGFSEDTVTVTSGGAPLSWTTMVSHDASSGSPNLGHVSAHVATVPEDRTGLTVTAGSEMMEPLSLKVYVLTGVDPDAPVGATGRGSSEENEISPTAYTSTVPHSRGFAVATDWLANGLPTSADDEDAFHLDGVVSGLSVAKPAADPVPGTDVVMDFDAPGSGGAAWNWVAVEILPASGADVMAPWLVDHAPAADAAGVPRATAVTATFNEPVDPVTVTVEVRDPGDTLVPGSTSYDPVSRAATFAPGAALAATTTYTVTVSGAEDQSGQVMAPYPWSFTTGVIGVDASSPDRVTTTGSSVMVTTAPFSPPAGSVLLAMVSADTGSSSGVTVTMSNNDTPLSWTTVAEQDLPTSATPGHSSAHVAVVPTGRTGLAVTATSDGNLPLSLKVYVLTGVDLADPVGAVGKGFSSINNISPTGYTSTVPNSRGFAVATDATAQGIPDSSTGGEDAFSSFGMISGLSVAKPGADPLPGTDVAMNFDAPGAGSTEWTWVAVEVRPAD